MSQAPALCQNLPRPLIHFLPLCSLNKNTRKFSGLANYGKTLDITVEDGIVVLHRSNKKQGGKLVGTPIRKTNAVRVNRAAKAVARSVRPDLEVRAALPRFGWSRAGGRCGWARRLARTSAPGIQGTDPRVCA